MKLTGSNQSGKTMTTHEASEALLKADGAYSVKIEKEGCISVFYRGGRLVLTSDRADGVMDTDYITAAIAKIEAR